MSEFTVRPACEGDSDRLLEIHESSYPDPRGRAERRRNFERNPLGGFDRLRVLEEDGRVVAHAFLFSLEAWFGGRTVTTAGIASVGVAPEARGRRVASRLLSALHEEAHASGAALSVLFAFRQGFYARHGYAPTSPSRRLTLHPGSIPRAWSAPRPDLVLRVADGADREGICAAYERAAKRATGWITRPAALWDECLLDERRRWYVVARAPAETSSGPTSRRGQQIAGFVSWTVTQPEAHASTALALHDLVADDDEPRRALWGLVGAQRDQVDVVHAHLDALDPLDRALLDADAGRAGTADVEHALGTLVGGPMVRITDPARALAARGYAYDGTLELDVEGERLHLEVQAGEARVGPSRATSAITLDRATLSAIAYGALAPSAASRLGWLHAPDIGTMRAADAVFGLPPYHAIDTF